MTLGLTIAGGAAQGAGFALTLYELSRTQRREFPDHVPWHHRAFEWVRRKVRPHEPKVVEGAAHVTAGATISVSGEAVRAPWSLEERVDRLEDDLRSLRAQQATTRAKLEGSIEEVNRRIDTTADSLRQQADEREALRKQQLRESMIFERIGVALFITGIVLSVLGSTVYRIQYRRQRRRPGARARSGPRAAQTRRHIFGTTGANRSASESSEAQRIRAFMPERRPGGEFKPSIAH